MLSIVTRVFATVLCVSVVVPAEATLLSRLGGAAAYDDVLDITWVTDADLSGPNPNTWDNQVAWASGLDYHGFDDWRLASMSVDELTNGDNTTNSVVDCSTATEEECRDNELGYMYYYNLTPSLDTPPTDFGTNLSGDQTVGGVTLTDIQFGSWSGTEFSSFSAWIFFFGFGGQNVGNKDIDGLYGWAVRSGDVAAAPEPGTVFLMGAGLAGLLGFGRSKRRR